MVCVGTNTQFPAPNIVSDDFGTVSGGYDNTPGAGNGNGVDATVGRGSHNTASGEYSIVSGNEQNAASAVNSTVAGGYYDVASASSSTVGGG